MYTKQHKTVGLEAPYSGPFPVVSRPTRSTVKIKVGLTRAGEDRHEVRHWRDLKVAHMAPDAKEAARPMRGRPVKTCVQSGPDSTTEKSGIQDGGNINKPVAPSTHAEDAVITNVRSTRNPNPQYVDGIGPPSLPPFPKAGISNKISTWSASKEELAILNASIAGGRHSVNGA